MRSGRSDALEDALVRLSPGRLPTDAVARRDTPDLHVTAIRRLPPVAPELAPFPEDCDPVLRETLEARGIAHLYTHQAAAIRHALDGRNVIVTTPTASGKTLCYNAPVLHAILQDPSSRSLYLFPTKALAQDQLAELQGLCEAIQVRTGREVGVFTYDGDTPQDARRSIRARAHVVLTNPDMLHSGVLPHHPRWAKLFEGLRYIVIDELHAYRGVFGSHLGNVLRRLRRVCRHYGSDPVFICSSATIANPRELAERLTERPFELVDRSGAPRGEKFFLFVNPPVVNRQLGIRRSYLAEARRVSSEFLRRGLQVIVFAQSRLSAEILTTYLKDDFGAGPGDAERIRGYRGGYLPNRRREIERGLRAGAVRGVVSTSALELGIDVGALDVSVMAGYPGTIASTWQRAGRAGRRSGRSAAVLVASSAPLDQFIVRHPSYFFDSPPERALIDPDNLHILVDHVKCAAFELPFGSDEQFGRYDVQEILGVLAEQGLVYCPPADTPERYDANVPGAGVGPHASEKAPSDSEVALASGGGAALPGSGEVESLRSRPSDGEAAPASGGGASSPGSGEVESLRSRPSDGEAAPASGGGAPREIRRWTWTSESYPANAVSLRSVSSDNFVVVDTTHEPRVIGETDFTSGPATLHPKAIYLIEGALFQVDTLDFEGRKAYVREVDCDYYTDAITNTRVTILDLFEGNSEEGRSHGEVHVVSRVVGFKKIKFYTNENVGSGELDLPEQQMHTTAYWLTLPAAIMDVMPYGPDDRRDGIVALAFALKQLAQLLLMCDRHDIGVSIDTGEQVDPSSASAPLDGAAARLFIYDNYPGGIGFSEPLYRMHHELLEGAERLISECPCDNGCPGCVGPVGDTGPLAKAAALRILGLILGRSRAEALAPSSEQVF